MPKIEVIIDGVDVTPKSLLSDEMRSEAAKNLGDPNSSKTFMGELSMQSFGFQELSIGGSTTSAGVTVSKANLTDPNGMVQEMPTVSSKVEEKSSQDASNIDDSISNQKHITEAEKNQEFECSCVYRAGCRRKQRCLFWSCDLRSPISAPSNSSAL